MNASLPATERISREGLSADHKGAEKGSEAMEQLDQAPRTAIQSVCIVGLGAVGNPTARFFAKSGVPTYGCDINPKAADALDGVLKETSTSLEWLPLADLYIV